MEECCVYVILTHYGTYYTGISNNLIRRWFEHSSGKSSYLRRFKPKEVIYVEFCENRRVAARKERYIKKVGARKYMLKLEFRS